MNDKTKALVYIVISTLAFSAMGAFVKYLVNTPIYEKVFFRNLISLFVAAYILLHRSFKSKDKIRVFGALKNQKYLIIRSLFGFLGVILNFYAISHLYLADAQILNRTSPFFVSIFAAIFLKEKLAKINIYALILASIGALFVLTQVRQ